MSKLINTPPGPMGGKNGPVGEAQERREVLMGLGRFVAVTSPTVALLLAADGKLARAAHTSGVTGVSGPTGGPGPVTLGEWIENPAARQLHERKISSSFN